MQIEFVFALQHCGTVYKYIVPLESRNVNIIIAALKCCSIMERYKWFGNATSVAQIITHFNASI